MIIKAILLLIKVPFLLIIGLLPKVNITLPSSLFNSLHSLLYGVGYLLPLKGLVPIFVMSLSLSLFKITMAIILRIKSFIPTMGN